MCTFGETVGKACPLLDHHQHQRPYGSKHFDFPLWTLKTGRFPYMSGGHSPITRSFSAPTTTSCSSAEKRSFPEVDLTSNILPRALNPLDPKPNTERQRGDIKEERLELQLITYWITSVFEHLKCTKVENNQSVLKDMQNNSLHLWNKTPKKYIIYEFHEWNQTKPDILELWKNQHNFLQ